VIQRRAIAGLALAASCTMLAACGFQAPDVTNTEHSEVQGTSFAVGAVRIDAAFVTPVPTSETATPLYLVVTFVNDGSKADTLTGATSSVGSVSITGPGTTLGQLRLPPGVPVQVEDPALNVPGPTMTIAAATTPALGSFVKVSFTFANSGTSSTVQVPVVPAGETEAPTVDVSTSPATPPPVSGDSAND
jgi:hypothetical protein